MLWQVSRLVTGKISHLKGGEKIDAKGSGPHKLLTATKFPALFILVWQVVMELIVQ